MSALRKQMQADKVVHGLAPRTQKAYMDAVAAIACFYHRSPDLLSVTEIEQYLHHLIADRLVPGPPRIRRSAHCGFCSM